MRLIVGDGRMVMLGILDWWFVILGWLGVSSYLIKLKNADVVY